jgi:hypothetical protein
VGVGLSAGSSAGVGVRIGVWRRLGACAGLALGLAGCGSQELDPIQEPGAPSALQRVEAGVDDAGASGSDVGEAVNPSGCKRGIATNSAPGAAFSPGGGKAGTSWWYNWTNQGPTAGAGIEYVPMLWGGMSLAGAIPPTSRFLLGFNEPSFTSQANLSAAQAAADWPKVEAAARASGAAIVSPAVSFCGSASDGSQCNEPSVYDPYTYLKDFFAACSGCRVDYVAVHWYNCDVPSLQGYLEGNLDAGGGLQGFTQFGKPIWVTELSCDSTHSVADNKAYMQAAVPYLEASPHVHRYAWFNAAPIPNAALTNADGSLTDLGTTYVSLAQACQ